MNTLRVIAYEIPFTMGYEFIKPINTCVAIDDMVYIYNTLRELIPVGKYEYCIDTVKHAVREGKYDWAYISISENDNVSYSLDDNVLVNDQEVKTFPGDHSPKGKISNRTMIMFNDFLKTANRDNPDMVEALGISLNDGFFRKQLEEIIEGDSVGELSSMEKEIIVRSVFEGRQFIADYVASLMKSNKADRYLDINYFFRRVFNLEVYQYLSYGHIDLEDD